MPVFGEGRGKAPAWCELELFEILHLLPGDMRELRREGKKEKLIVCEGQCLVAVGRSSVSAAQGANLDLSPEDDRFLIHDIEEPVVAIRMSGRWGDEVGGSGLFSVQAKSPPPKGDTPYRYRKVTSFDNHFHDCDEYWIVYDGTGVAYSEGKRYEVGPGDCVATGTGFHHDFPEVIESPVKAVYFETTMEREKRRGHLHEPADGRAVPAAGRT